MFIHSLLTIFSSLFLLTILANPIVKTFQNSLLISKRRITRVFVNIYWELTSTHATLIVMFMKSILAAMPLFIPKITNSIPSNNPPWWTSNIKHKINCLRSIRKRRKHNLLPLSQRVRELELSLQVEMITVKNDFELKLVQDFVLNSSKIYKYQYCVSKWKEIPFTMHLNSD